MFLTYERNVVKLAERMGLPLAYLTGMDIAADPHLLDGASALISPGHDEYWTPAERAHVTAARAAGVNLAFLGANAMFRRTRLDATALGADRLVICYKTSYPRDPMFGVQDALVTSDWREPPRPDPESSLIGTLYEGYPAVASYVVAAPDSWVFAGTGVAAGARFGNLVGVEYNRVNPGLPGAAADPGPVPLAAGVPGGGELRRFGLLHARRRGRRLQRRHHALGGGDLRRPPARHFGDDVQLRPAGDGERAPRLRRRPRRGHPSRPGQPGRHARVLRRPDRQPRRLAVSRAAAPAGRRPRRPVPE